jgi:hypothetical protein
MSSGRLGMYSQWMATATLWLIVLMLLLNAAAWINLPLSAMVLGNGLAFSLTDSLMATFKVNISTFPWWQRVGGIVLSSMPLVALVMGLGHLRALFQAYGRQEYFSIAGVRHLKRMGQSVMLWVLLNLLCQPALSVWMTMRQPAGERVLSVGFSSGDVVALFLAGCIAIIARILERANILQVENQQFI